MGELDTYSLIDFVPLEPEVYRRLFERQNAALWPSQPLTLLLGMLATWLAWRSPGRRLGLVLAGCWIWVGATFHLTLYRELSWAAGYLGWAFIAQGLALGACGWLGGLAAADAESRAARQRVGLALSVFGIVVYPFVTLARATDRLGIELFGTAPDPTALVTLGCLLIVRRASWLLMLIPLAWCALSSATWLALDQPIGLVTLAAALSALSLGFASGWRSRPGGAPD